ncbi:hypothetical protein [Salmonella enterica]|uniref:hypothetical protein n=1 Tax=Salmonella enterica TaxID=28901 RepID=UPI0021DA7162|nr:hypothetical protein [Salmonella enterica]
MGDTALYSADTLRLLHQQQQLFVTRVPFTLLEARQAVGTVGDVPLQVLDNGYQGRWMGSGYASVPPTLAVLHREQTSLREQQTLTRNLLRESTRELKDFNRLCARRFTCQTDAQAEPGRFTPKNSRNPRTTGLKRSANLTQLLRHSPRKPHSVLQCLPAFTPFRTSTPASRQDEMRGTSHNFDQIHDAVPLKKNTQRGLLVLIIPLHLHRLRLAVSN